MNNVGKVLKDFLNSPGIENALNAHDWKTIHKELSKNEYNIMPEFVQVLHALGVEKEMFKAFGFIPIRSFWWNSRIIKYDIPEGIDCIYDKAFSFCMNLENVKLPNSMVKIYKDAFAGDAKLKDINFPNSLTFLGDDAFYMCGLESVNIPSGVTTGTGVFSGCLSLKSATIDSKYLNNNIFKGCKSLKNVKIGKSVEEIDAGVFMGCNSLSKINYEGTAEEWKRIFITSENNTKLFGLKVKCADGVTLKYCVSAWYPI